MTSAGKSALIIVDVQNDFCPGGALPVRDGDAIVPVINRLQRRFDVVVATQDWHPADHSSFVSNNPDSGIWPDHCVQGSHGAELVAALDTSLIARVFQKGVDVAVDSYSGFFDNDRRTSTGLAEYLRQKNVQRVSIAGLATDYCVKATALDARREGFETTVIRDAVRGVDINEGDCECAFQEIQAAGVRLGESSEL